MMCQGSRFYILVAVLLAVSFLTNCERDREQDRVGKVIATMQKAAEKKEIRKILSHLSKTYRDPQGHNYEGIRELLLIYFWKHQKISVFLTNLEITVQDSSAKARFQSILSGATGPDRGIVPEALGVYRFDVLLIKEAGEWKILSAKWDRFPDGAF